VGNLNYLINEYKTTKFMKKILFVLASMAVLSAHSQNEGNINGTLINIPENERQKFRDMPAGQITEVINHYFTYSSVNISNGYTPPSGQQVFVVFNFGNGSGHAARYLGCSNGDVLCNDGYHPLSQVSSAYSISAVK
jgi:hypothetical protein